MTKFNIKIPKNSKQSINIQIENEILNIEISNTPLNPKQANTNQINEDVIRKIYFSDYELLKKLAFQKNKKYPDLLQELFIYIKKYDFTKSDFNNFYIRNAANTSTNLKSIRIRKEYWDYFTKISNKLGVSNKSLISASINKFLIHNDFQNSYV